MELRSIQQQLSQLEPMERSLEALYAQRRSCDQSVISSRAASRTAQEEADGLENRNVSNFLLQLTGKLEQRRQQAQQKYREALAKQTAAEAELEQIDQKICLHRSQLAQLRLLQEQYRQTLDEKRLSLRESGTEAGNRLLALEAQIAEAKKQRNEIREAASAGRRAKGTADRVLSQLKDADNWNTWDLVGGDGVITHLAKHSHLDEAQALLQDLQNDLSRFRTELEDTHIGTAVQVNADSFLRFADWFFDGLLVDLTMRDKIRQAQQSVGVTREQLTRVLEKLSQMENARSAEITRWGRELEMLVINA